MYKGQTDARRKANQKYLKESVEDIRIRVPRGQKEVYKAHADRQGESLNSFVIRAMNDTMARDSSSSAVPTQASQQAPETPQDEPLVLVEIGYDPIAGKPLYREKNTGKQYTVEAIPISSELSEDITDDLPF